VRAFTLIEVLAVITLLSLATAVGVASLGSASQRARLDQAAATLRDADAQARLLSRMGSSVTLAVHEGRVSIESDRDAFSSILPDGTSVEMAALPAGRSAPRILFDRLGRSTDYRVAVASAGSTRVWLVAGATGWIDERSSSEDAP